MKFVINLLLYSISFAVLVVTSDVIWEDYKTKFGKGYPTEKEDLMRHAIFQDNLKKIQNHNELYRKGKVSYRLGVTGLTDLSESEFLERLNGNEGIYRKMFRTSRFDLPPNLELSASVDWRNTEGVVTEVPDGTSCNAAWAFSTIASIEAQNVILHNNHTQLSVQELVDCTDYGEFNSGCEGGYVDNAFDYVLSNGISLNSSYPWMGATESICAYYGDGGEKFRIAGVRNISGISSLEMALDLIGPVVALIDARFIQNYDGSDVFESSDCLAANETTINHAVLVVGYSNLGGYGYWIVRNSWGTSWGDEGYLYLTKTVHYDCGVTSHVLYPVLG